MARRKRFKRRVATARKVATMKRRTTKKGSSTNPMKMILPAMGYGASRSYLSNMAQPITNKMGMAGQYADELLFGVAGYYIAKKNVFGMRKVGEAMLIVESASVGNQLVNGMGGSVAKSSEIYIN